MLGVIIPVRLVLIGVIDARRIEVIKFKQKEGIASRIDPLKRKRAWLHDLDDAVADHKFEATGFGRRSDRQEIQSSPGGEMSMVAILPHERSESLANRLMAVPHDTSWCCGAADDTSDRRVPSGAATFVKIVERQWESPTYFARATHLARRCCATRPAGASSM